MDIFEDAVKRIEEEMTQITQPLFRLRKDSGMNKATRYITSAVTGDWDKYALGYKEAADLVVENLSNSRWTADVLIYPVVFLYRQYIELRLKELLLTSSQLLGSAPELAYDHNLMALWEKVRINLEAIWPDKKSKEWDKKLKTRFEELSGVDKASFSFRYPVNKRGEPNLTEIQGIDLAQVKRGIQAISNILEGASTGIDEALKAKHEIMAERQADMNYHREN